MPDVLGAERARYAGKHVLVVGSGHSAQRTLLELARLAEQEPEPRLLWAIQRPAVQHRRASDRSDRLSRMASVSEASVQDVSAAEREALVSLRFWVLAGACGLALLGSAVVFAHHIAYLVSRSYGSLLAATVAGALELTSLPGRLFLNLLSSVRVSCPKPCWRPDGVDSGVERPVALAVCATLWGSLRHAFPLACPGDSRPFRQMGL